MNKSSTLTFITTSKDKFNETKLFLENNLSFKVNLVNINNVNLFEIQGSSEEILKDKIRQASKLIEGPFLVEDSAFSLTNMEELPGPYIKDFFCRLGNLRLYKLFAPFLTGVNDFDATDISYLGFSLNINEKSNDINKNDTLIFKGQTVGKIIPPVNDPKDEYNWCFFFIPEGESLTYGEMTSEVKNRISARRKSLNLLSEYLEQNRNNFI